MKKIAVIGAGISGLSIARLLKDGSNQVTVFEKEHTPGGLVRCRLVGDNIFHICGGHVFNTKRKDVLDWFWHIMPQDEFFKKDRNSVVMFDEHKRIPYPIEDHFYLLSEEEQMAIIRDLLTTDDTQVVDNFDQFLHKQFGETLYNLYFKPYNNKVWQEDLRKIPIAWLEGKLPVSDKAKILFNNINRVDEKLFVHSAFWYNAVLGSQRIADLLSLGLDVRYGCNVEKAIRRDGVWLVNDECYDTVVFCGNIKQLPFFVDGVDIAQFEQEINQLAFHGTTSVFCEIDANPYSWIYLPDEAYKCHRIICTGNFNRNANKETRITATVEFTNFISKDDILDSLRNVPLHPRYIDHVFNEYSYPVQNPTSRSMIASLKTRLEPNNFFLLGRFAEWEYYNMDAAIGAAMDLSKKLV